jgi:hypothetical protein
MPIHCLHHYFQPGLIPLQLTNLDYCGHIEPLPYPDDLETQRVEELSLVGLSPPALELLPFPVESKETRGIQLPMGSGLEHHSHVSLIDLIDLKAQLELHFCPGHQDGLLE